MILDISTTHHEASHQVAKVISDRINAFAPTMHRKFVLALPARETFVEVYRFLASFCRAQQVSFEYVVVFVLDEFVGLGADHPDSNAALMELEFFSQVDLPPGQVNLLAGAFPSGDECTYYEARIAAMGGIHLVVADLGANGRLGLNEPGGSLTSRTRRVELDATTDLTRFVDTSPGPTHALSIGIGTILDSSEIIVLASGATVASAIKHSFQGSISHLWPASVLQLHPEVVGYIDTPASSQLDAAVRTMLSPALSVETSPTSTLPSLPSPSTIFTPPELCVMPAAAFGFPYTTLPSPALEPIPESLELELGGCAPKHVLPHTDHHDIHHHLDPTCSGVAPASGAANTPLVPVVPAKKGAGVKILKQRPGLRLITQSTPETRVKPMTQLGQPVGLVVAGVTHQLRKLQEDMQMQDEEDDAGPGW